MIRIHKIISHADSITAAQEYVYGFFDNSMLIHYDTVKVVSVRSLSAADASFWSETESAIAENRSVLNRYVDELKETGCSSLDDFSCIAQGYSSKVFHLIAHLLDGFIGIDSIFYSLPEDSHWLSDTLRKKIIADPDHYWLMHVEGHFASKTKASLINL